MSSEIRVMRTERKYPVDTLRASSLFSRLSCVLQGDSINGTSSYLVRSLYFDTVCNDDYFDKMAGLERRKKIRLRIYDPNAQTAKLEIKEKQGNAQLKRSLLLSREQAIRIQNSDYSALKEIESPLAAELYGIMQTQCYRPVCIVEYDRIAFMNPTNDTRITLDSKIRSNEGNFSIFDPDLVTYPVSSFSETILEVKYNGFLLSYIKDMLGSLYCTESANSKYCMARKFGLG